MAAQGNEAANGRERYDLVLAGGTVVDPAAGRHEPADVAFAGGLLARVGPSLAAAAERVVDCRGALVTPGLVDYHVHIFNTVSTIGAPVDQACLARGVTLAVDAGSAGCWTYPAFERFVVQPAPIPVLAFLNVSAIGILSLGVGELRLLDYLDVDSAVETAATHPDIIRGFKVRLGHHIVGDTCLPALQRARAIGDAARLPVMIHIGDSPEPLPTILEHLRPGDVVSHCYTGLPYGILDDGAVLPAVREARAAGVLFDSAHGSSNLAFAVARRAIEQGFLPDTISSDNSLRNWNGPVYDLPTTMSKFLALGIPLEQVVERVTSLPAAILGLTEQGVGALTPGRSRDATVLRLTDETFTLRDSAGDTLQAPRLEPLYAVRGGALTPCAPWRGATAQ
jgi:dihydroorotase